LNHLGALTKEQFDSLTEWQRMDRRIKELEKQKINLREAYDALKIEADDLKRMHHEVHYHFLHDSEVHNHAHWCWMWDDENHLESLSCPVLIPADWLRILLKDAREGKPAVLKSTDDSNQLSMDIDNDVVIVNQIHVGD
jgi:predicted nuclease with TOPRIM domain